MSDIPEVDLIAYAITETFGERCPDYEETCPCSKAWGQYDALAAAEQRGAERERERIANLCDDFVKTGTILWAKEDDPDRAALHLAQAYGVRSLAAAIRRGEG